MISFNVGDVPVAFLRCKDISSVLMAPNSVDAVLRLAQGTNVPKGFPGA